MKSYNVTVKAVVTVAACSQKEAAKIALSGVAKAPELLMAEYIHDGYETILDVDAPEEKPVPVSPRAKDDIQF